MCCVVCVGVGFGWCMYGVLTEMLSDEGGRTEEIGKGMDGNGIAWRNRQQRCRTVKLEFLHIGDNKLADYE